MLVIPPYMLKNYNLDTLELGSVIYEPEAEKLYMILDQGKLTQLNIKEVTAEDLDRFASKGGLIEISNAVDLARTLTLVKDSTIVNNGTLSYSKARGRAFINVSGKTTIIEGEGTFNSVGNNKYCMAVWAQGNGKVIINGGKFTNVGAGEDDHYDLIYASGSATVEINGGEFECQTPKWTLNISDADRATAKIVVKGGKFHGFDPSKDANGDGIFLAEGYKVIEEDGIYTVVKE